MHSGAGAHDLPEVHIDPHARELIPSRLRLVGFLVRLLLGLTL
jgi:hypothetical protein